MTFRLDPNLVGVAGLRLDFDAGPEATIQITYADGTQSPLGAIGLDGVYRLTRGMNLDQAGHPFVDFQDLSVGMRGRWMDARTFALEYDTIVNYYSYILQMRFDGDRLSLALSDRAALPLATITGTLAEH